MDIISYAARKAGIRRLVTVERGGAIPCNLEVLARADDAGSLMVFVINHDDTEATCQVTVAPEHLSRPGLRGAQAWNLLAGKLIEEETDGKFDLPVAAWKPAVFLVGRGEALAPVKAAQAKLNAMDLSVPRYFLDRPELNQDEYNTPIPAIGR